MSSIFDSPIDAQQEPMLMIARRALPEAQALFAGAVDRVAAADAVTSWFGADFYPETASSLALVQEGGRLDDLVGEVLRVQRTWPSGDAAVYVFVDAATQLESGVDLALARRAFLSLALLSTEEIVAAVEVIA